MDEIRGALEHLAQSVCDGLERSLGRGVEIGLHGRWDDHEVAKRTLPLRAAVVELKSPLADVIVAVTTMREEVLRSALAASIQAMCQSLGCPPDFEMPEVHEFDDREVALEQLDALFDEPTLHFITPKGDLLLVVGSGLPPVVLGILRGEIDVTATVDHESVERLRGLNEDLAAAAAFQRDDSEMPMQADTSIAGADEGDMMTIGGGTPIPAPEVAYQPGTNPLAGQQGVQAAALPDFGAAASDPYGATAASNALAAQPHMEQLLSGVEVDLSAELGRANMQLGQISSLGRDSVFTLEQSVDDPVHVYVNGELFGTARLVVVGDEYGIEMIDVFDHQPAVAAQYPLAA